MENRNEYVVLTEDAKGDIPRILQEIGPGIKTVSIYTEEGLGETFSGWINENFVGLKCSVLVKNLNPRIKVVCSLYNILLKYNQTVTIHVSIENFKGDIGEFLKLIHNLYSVRINNFKNLSCLICSMPKVIYIENCDIKNSSGAWASLPLSTEALIFKNCRFVDSTSIKDFALQCNLLREVQLLGMEPFTTYFIGRENGYCVKVESIPL